MATGPVCIRCGNPLIPGASVCNVCGQPAPAPVKVKKPVNKKAVKRAIIAAAIIVALIGATFGGIFISKVVRYNNAANMMEAGDYAGAQEIFTNLEDYKDASTQADICGNFIVYNEAQALMDQGDYETALEKFQSLGSFEDASAKADECQNNIDYKNATRYYSDGQYYKAYSLFSGLPAGFKDAAEMAENCIQPMPSVSKVLYLNPAYSEAAAGLEVTDTCSSDFYRCIRIYTQGGELVSSAFLRPGESVFLIFSPGTYTIKIGVGEMWFGDEDTFGAQGKYGILPGLNTDLSLTFEYNEAWTYTLSDYNTGSDGNSRLPISYGNF